jgi:hypothetical protein
MRWLDDVESDLKNVTVNEWAEMMRDTEQWRLIVERTMLVQGCSSESSGDLL